MIRAGSRVRPVKTASISRARTGLRAPGCGAERERPRHGARPADGPDATCFAAAARAQPSHTPARTLTGGRFPRGSTSRGTSSSRSRPIPGRARVRSSAAEERSSTANLRRGRRRRSPLGATAARPRRRPRRPRARPRAARRSTGTRCMLGALKAGAGRRFPAPTCCGPRPRVPRPRTRAHACSSADRSRRGEVERHARATRDAARRCSTSTRRGRSSARSRIAPRRGHTAAEDRPSSSTPRARPRTRRASCTRTATASQSARRPSAGSTRGRTTSSGARPAQAGRSRSGTCCSARGLRGSRSSSTRAGSTPAERFELIGRARRHGALPGADRVPAAWRSWTRSPLRPVRRSATPCPPASRSTPR